MLSFMSLAQYNEMQVEVIISYPWRGVKAGRAKIEDILFSWIPETKGHGTELQLKHKGYKQQ